MELQPSQTVYEVSTGHLWYLIRAGKLVPSIQCKNVERATGKKSSMMSSVAAQPNAPDTLQETSKYVVQSSAWVEAKT